MTPYEEIQLNGKSPYTKKMICHADIGGVEKTFEFNVLPKADEDDIFCAMVTAFLDSIKMWYEEDQENGSTQT